jgi:gamma-glutamyl-gamma-aminobutyraldehyde dehydrogenase
VNPRAEAFIGGSFAAATASDADDALRLANDTRYGLAAAIWTSDLPTAGRLARHGRDRSLHALDSFTQLETTWISLA